LRFSRRSGAPTPHPDHCWPVCSRSRAAPRPRSVFHTLRRIPLSRSRIVSPRPLPPWCSLPSRIRSIQRHRCRRRRSCRTRVMHHLRGVAPQLSPYR
jgi:hypothetical protein